jgi:hypothetical protein
VRLSHLRDDQALRGLIVLYGLIISVQF